MGDLRFKSFKDWQLQTISEDVAKAAKLRKISAAQKASNAKRDIPGPPVIR